MRRLVSSAVARLASSRSQTVISASTLPTMRCCSASGGREQEPASCRRRFFVLHLLLHGTGIGRGQRKTNVQKHGLDFDDARHLDWDNATYLEDARLAYPEPRFWTFAKDKAGRLHVVTFCIRGTKVRIISFRKANRREVNRHG